MAAILLLADLRLADDAAKVVIVAANQSGEIRAADHSWIEPLDGELPRNLRSARGRAEPFAELGNYFSRGLRRRKRAEPGLRLVIRIARLGDRRNIRHRVDARSGRHRQRAQLT